MTGGWGVSQCLCLLYHDWNNSLLLSTQSINMFLNRIQITFVSKARCTERMFGYVWLWKTTQEYFFWQFTRVERWLQSGEPSKCGRWLGWGHRERIGGGGTGGKNANSIRIVQDHWEMKCGNASALSRSQKGHKFRFLVRITYRQNQRLYDLEILFWWVFKRWVSCEVPRSVAKTIIRWIHTDFYLDTQICQFIEERWIPKRDPGTELQCLLATSFVALDLAIQWCSLLSVQWRVLPRTCQV